MLHRSIRVGLRVAAVLVIALGVYWFSGDNVFNTKYQYVQNDWKDKVKIITLEDGTTVSLNYMAGLYYPKHFNHNKRKIKLEGNAFFDVARDESKPFVVETPLSMVQVLGTSFNVDAESHKTIVTVASGKVKVANKIDQNSGVVLLPDEQAIQDGDSWHKKQVVSRNFIGWKTGNYIFENTSLSEVMNLLEKRFHFSTHFSDNKLKSRELTAEFNKQSLKDIIEIIQLSCQVRINLESNKLTISKYE